MDRMFKLQSEWHDEVRFQDPAAIARLLAYRAPYYFDRWTFAAYDDEPSLEEDGLRCIPIGTVQFVGKWLETLGAADPKMTPLEVPAALSAYLGREYFVSKGTDIPAECLDGSKWFVKDAGQLKKWNSNLYDDRDLSCFIEPDELYVVSQRVPLVSEWRVFVFEDEIVGCENYSGELLAFPDGKRLEEMATTYAADLHPSAYTLDVGVLKDGTTIPIEIHPFVACGLYGFNDSVLLNMFEGGWLWYFSQSDGCPKIAEAR